MKKFLFLTAIIAVMASCSNEEPITKPGSVNPGESNAVVSINLQGSDMESSANRSTAAIPTQASDNTINSVAIFVLDKTTQNVLWAKRFAVADLVDNKATMNINSGERDFYVVANPTPADTTALMAATNYNQLKAVLADLKNENEGAFRMIGKKTNVTINPSPATNNVMVNLSRIVARVQLKEITTQFTGGLTNQSLSIDSVYILNAIGTKNMMDSTLFASPATIYNRTASGFTFPLFDAYSSAVSINNTTAYTTAKANGNHFYVYPNNGTTFAAATKLVITGTLNGVRTYYPIAINVAGNGYTPATAGIFANSQYAITVKITSYGSTDPNTPVLPASVTIQCQPLNWAVVLNQNVQF